MRRNTILENGGFGITHSGTGAGNLILRNSIDDNGQKGISLSSQVNNGQSAPTNSGLANDFSFVLNGIAGHTYRIELFTSPEQDPSGYGEGRNWVWSADLVAGSGGEIVVDVGTASRHRRTFGRRSPRLGRRDRDGARHKRYFRVFTSHCLVSRQWWRWRHAADVGRFDLNSETLEPRRACLAADPRGFRGSVVVLSHLYRQGFGSVAGTRPQESVPAGCLLSRSLGVTDRRGTGHGEAQCGQNAQRAK